MSQTAECPVITFVFKIVESNWSVLQSLEGSIAFHDLEVQSLAQSIVENSRIEITQIVVRASCKETVVIEIWNLITVGSHDSGSQGSEIISLGLVSFIIE